MAERLGHGDHRPPQVAQHLPVANLLGIDGVAAGVLVGGEQVFEIADATDPPWAAEPPGPGAQPADVLGRVPDMSQFDGASSSVSSTVTVCKRARIRPHSTAKTCRAAP